MADLAEAKKNAIDFLLESVDKSWGFKPDDNDPLWFEAHLYLAHKGIISKLEWGEKIDEIWNAWLLAHKNTPILQVPRGVYFWPAVNRYFFNPGDPEIPDWETDFYIENHLAMFRTKEVFRLPGYKDCFTRAKRELGAKLGSVPDPSRIGEGRLLWQIMRSPFLRSALKDSLGAVALRFIDAERNAETMVPMFDPETVILLPIMPADIFFLLTANQEDNLDLAKLYLNRDLTRQRRDGSFHEDVIETCLNLCSIYLCGIDPGGVITSRAIAWLLNVQKENGSWQYLGTDDIINLDKINGEDIFLTVFVLETLDLITNDKPLPIWAKNVAPPQPPSKAFQGIGHPLTIPEGMKWGDVSITFISDEAVEIRVRDPLGIKNFIELDFKDRRTNRPDYKWEVLKVLAHNGGLISWKDKSASSKWKPHIKILRKRLRAIFKIDDDPFFPYRRSGGYKAKFSITFREEN